MLKLITFAFNPCFPWGLVSFIFSALCLRPTQEVCSGGVQGLGLSLDIDKFWTVLSAPYVFSNCPSGGWASLHRRNAHLSMSIISMALCLGSSHLGVCLHVYFVLMVTICNSLELQSHKLYSLLHRFPEFVASLLHIFPAVVSDSMYHIDL
jgi:hypothetical protein